MLYLDKISTAECFIRGEVYFIKGELDSSTLFWKKRSEIDLKKQFLFN